MKKAIIQGLAALLILTAAISQAVTLPDVTTCQDELHHVAPHIGRLHLPAQYWQWMVEAGRDYGVDPYLIAAFAAIESRFDPRATSGRGRCIGLMQLERDMARDLGVNPWDPRENIRGGAQVLARLMRRYGGDLRRVCRRYNAKSNGAYEREIVRAYRQAKG